MKKTSDKISRRDKPMAKEYQFDYRKAKPNRFAARMPKNSIAVVLEPDVAAVFRSSEVVNDLLRSIIAATSERR